jgi:hypothetical protein
MKLFKVMGIVIILISIALVAIPRFTDCESQGKAIEVANSVPVPMKCHWSGIAEIGVAVPMYILGAVMTTSRRRNMFSLLSVFGVVLGGLAIAFPTVLIGVCPDRTMICSTLMKPALILLGSGAVGLSALALGLSLPVRNLFRALLFSIVVLNKKVVAWKGV